MAEAPAQTPSGDTKGTGSLVKFFEHVVSKQFTGSETFTTLVPEKMLKIYFQCWPGHEEASGVEHSETTKTVTYSFKVSGRSVINDANIGPGGLVRVPLETGKTGYLEIFGTKYKVKALDPLEGLTTNKDRQRRLLALGYELKWVDGIVGPKTDRSTLNFQADDSTLVPDGDAPSATRDKLKEKVDDHVTAP